MKYIKKIPVLCDCVIINILASQCPLSKTQLKNCLNKGCVWLSRAGKKERRIRRAQSLLRKGDTISLYYNSQVIDQPRLPDPECIAQENGYSIWNKPAMMPSQGTRFGDHNTLLRRATQLLPHHIAPPYLVHRLDRETKGLLLLAHGSRNAARFSALFQKRQITKRYRAIIHGTLGMPGEKATIATPLDGKNAETSFTIVALGKDYTLIDISLGTGRFHQIRRHFSEEGHPVVGDTKYGTKNNTTPLCLVAYQLAFQCPNTRKNMVYTLPDLATALPSFETLSRKITT